MAIMGASGAGKTTLLNVLTFRNRGSLHIAGQVKINGTTVTSQEEISAVCGYVQQDDLFIGTLKVKEHMRFQAMLKLGDSLSPQEKNERVETMMQEVNICIHRDR